MIKKDQIRQLQQMAGLLFDSKLVDLKATARAMQETKDHLADLVADPVLANEVAKIAMAVAGLRYDRWADVRRAELNLTLARQTAEWLDARDVARLAFGKTRALEAVKAKMLAASVRQPR